MPKSDSPVVEISGTDIRKKFGHLVREPIEGDTYATILLSNRGTPKAIYRPFTEQEEREFIKRPYLPIIRLHDVLHYWGRSRQQLAEDGGQAALYRYAPAGWTKKDGSLAVQEFFGVMTLLTDKQAAQIRRQSVDHGMVKTFTQVKRPA